MTNPIPSALALSVINDSALITASPHRNNYAAVQTAVNALIAALSGGAAGQRLEAVDGTDVVWATTGYISSTNVSNPTTSYTAPAGVSMLDIALVAGGGAGGGSAITAAGQMSAGGGGGSGSYSQKQLTTLIGTHTVAVGLGGTGVAGGVGNTGGNTTFADTGSTVVASANGGLGGTTIAAGAILATVLGGTGGAATGVGNATIPGAPGGYAVLLNTATPASASGVGGQACRLGGGGGNARNATGGGSAGQNFGCGGGGAMSFASQAATLAGGAGSAGLIIVVAYG